MKNKNEPDYFDRLKILLDIALKYPRIIVISISLVFIFLLIQIPNLKYHINIDDIIDQSLVSNKELKEFKKDFKVGPSIFVVFKPINNSFTSENIINIKEFIFHLKVNFENIINIRSPFQIREPKFINDSLIYKILLTIAMI